MKSIVRDKTFLILIGACLAARIIFSIPVLVDVSRTSACYDAVAYDQIARNLLAGKGFSKDSAPPYLPNSTITPGYPGFVAGIYAVFGRSPLAVILIQIALNVLVLAVLYRFIRQRWGSRPALWMGIFFAADLNMAMFVAQETSETLFTVLLIAALIMMLKSFEEKRFGFAVAAGALLGAATLVRPVALYFALPCLVFVFISRVSWRKLVQWAVIVAMQIAFITPWVIRNRLVFGETFYTTVSDVNLLRYQAAPIKAALEKKTRDEAQAELEAEALRGKAWENEAQYFRILGGGARRYIVKHPLPYLGSLVMGGFASLIYPLPMRETGVYFRGEEALPRLEVAQSALLEGLKGRFFPALKTAWNERLRYYGLPVFILFLLYALFHLTKLAFGLRAYIIYGFKDPAMWLFLLVGLYFLGLLGFGISSRMRVPVEPLLVALAGAGISAKRSKSKRQEGEKKQ